MKKIKLKILKNLLENNKKNKKKNKKGRNKKNKEKRLKEMQIICLLNKEFQDICGYNYKNHFILSNKIQLGKIKSIFIDKYTKVNFNSGEYLVLWKDKKNLIQLFNEQKDIKVEHENIEKNVNKVKKQIKEKYQWERGVFIEIEKYKKCECVL